MPLYLIHQVAIGAAERREKMATVNEWNEIDEHGDNMACFVVDENCTCVDFIDKTEQPIDRLRRICKIEGVVIHDDAAVIKLCREYMDGDALLAAYREWRKSGLTQSPMGSGLIAKPCDGTN